MDRITFNVKSLPNSKLVPSKLDEDIPEKNNIEYLNIYKSNSSLIKSEKPLVIKTDMSNSFDKKIQRAVDSREDPIEQMAIDELTIGQPQTIQSKKRRIVLEHSDDSDPDDPDYSKISVDDFGMAMIRGMGWKEGKGVGRTFKKVCPVREVVLRPHLMGLGVEAALSKGEFLPGGTCVVIKGNYKGYYGTIESAMNGTVKIKISLIGKLVNVPQASVKVITVDDYNRNNGEVKVESKQETAQPSTDLEDSSWLRVNLIVRLIDKSSPHYRARAIIKEITAPSTCNCALEVGSYTVRDVREDVLETVLPQNSDELVFIVKGNHVGKVGRVVKKDRSKRTAMVELTGNPQPVSLKYDQICCIAPNPV